MLYGVIDECHHVFAYGDSDNNDNDNEIALHVNDTPVSAIKVPIEV